MMERNTAETRRASSYLPSAIALAGEVIEVFRLSDLQNLLNAAKVQQQKQDLNIAVLGRFKAGKSSFLNDIIGRPLLPVGVLPVTSVVTEICYGQDEYAEIVSSAGGIVRVPAIDIQAYVSESGNPQNVRGVDSVRVYLPSIAKYRGIRFVDTPGLESVFQHNTDTALSWSPNVDLAVVAVGVDPPLTQQDISLIERLYQYTPNITVLLTKIDILKQTERHEVEVFVRSKLRAQFGSAIPVFPYSIKPGFESLRQQFEEGQILRPLSSAHEQHEAILARKLRTLFRSAEDYLELALKAADVAAAEREELGVQVLGSPNVLADQKLQLQLLAKHAAGRTRSVIESHLDKTARGPLETRLAKRLDEELPTWRGTLAKELSAFEKWLQRELTQELAAISSGHSKAIREPLLEVERQCQSNLQAFRDQLSEKVRRVFGVPLQTTEVAIEIQEPRSPDISVGKVFDRSWELISLLIPMPLVRWAVHRRFYERAERAAYVNLSRLTTQWEERIHVAIFTTAKEAKQRLDELIVTVSRLLSGEDRYGKNGINSYLDRIRDTLKQLP
jgi:GTP-binding protein EngB required for normal cell division